MSSQPLKYKSELHVFLLLSLTNISPLTMASAEFFSCGTCSRQFARGWHARDRHCVQFGHRPPPFECHTCPAYFKTEDDMWQHMTVSNHFGFGCGMCALTWPSEDELEEHEIEDHDYWRCWDCHRGFRSEWEQQAHMEDAHGFECEWCDTLWATDEDLARHEEEVHLFCRVCCQDFDSADSYAEHRFSSKHFRQPTVCPFCPYACETAAGVVHHIERGACPIFITANHSALFGVIKRLAPNSYVTKLVLEFHPKKFLAKQGRWNGDAWECRLCFREFGSELTLNHHLSLPSRAQKRDGYCCPNDSCGEKFTTLAAAVDHLDAETCGHMCRGKVDCGIGALIV